MMSFFEKLKNGQEQEVEDVQSQPQPKKKGRKTEDTKKENKSKEWPEAEGELAIDVYQTDSEIVIQSPIAGIKKENIDISIENDIITIRGSREKPEEVEDKNYFIRECYWGSFSREIILPTEGDPSRAEATMKEGVLTLRIPKVDRERKKKIIIKE